MAAPHISAKAQPDTPQRPQQRGRNYALPKGHCTNRSEWRVLPGKPFERLSPHYQLACEFGSSLMAAWRNDGIEPVYLCEEHAQELGHSTQVRASTGSASATTSKNAETEAAAETKIVAAEVKPVAAEAKAAAVPEKVSSSISNAASPAATPIEIDAASPLISSTASNAAPSNASPTASLTAYNVPSNVPHSAPSNAPPNGGLNDASKTTSRPSEPLRKTTNSPRSPEERCAAIDQLISDLTMQLETLFSRSETSISLADTIDIPLDRATLEIIANDAMSDAQKDAAVQQLGTLQEHLKQDAGQHITALQAHQIKETMANYLSTENGLPDQAKPGYQAVHDSLKNAIHTAAPKAKHLEERLANLQKMKAELEDCPKAKELTPAVA